jgi:hemerythrin
MALALITWTDALSVNIKAIDDQHKKLITLINDLHSAMGSGKGKEAIGTVLDGLVEYTKTHFAYEEALMQKHNYVGYLGHKSQHDELTKQVLDLQSRYKEGKTLVTVEVMNFLKDWLSNHIQNTDKKYTSFLNSKGVV